MIVSKTPYGRIIGIVTVVLLIGSLLLGKRGGRTLAGSLTVSAIIFMVSGMTLNVPLDPSYLTIFGSLATAIILAGSLLPPIAALIAGVANSVIITLIVLFHQHTPAFDELIRQKLYTVFLVQPISIQIVIAVVTYVIMRSLVANIRRADRAEEVAALQKEIMEHERVRTNEQKQLKEAIQQILQTHMQLANGNLDARIIFNDGSMLWSIAHPLNNFINQAQHWKQDADRFEHTRKIAEQIALYMRQSRAQQKPVAIHQQTGTPLDPILQEMMHALEKPSGETRPAHGHASQ
jgi:hypothetical protein